MDLYSLVIIGRQKNCSRYHIKIIFVLLGWTQHTLIAIIMQDVECDLVLASVDEVEYLYKGKSCCEDCYRPVKKLEAVQQKEGTYFIQDGEIMVLKKEKN